MCLIKHCTVKTYEGVEIKLSVFLTSALDGGDWSTSRPGRFAFGTHRTGRVGPRAVLDAAMRKSPAPARNRTLVVQLVPYRLCRMGNGRIIVDQFEKVW